MVSRKSAFLYCGAFVAITFIAFIGFFQPLGHSMVRSYNVENAQSQN